VIYLQEGEESDDSEVGHPNIESAAADAETVEPALPDPEPAVPALLEPPSQKENDSENTPIVSPT